MATITDTVNSNNSYTNTAQTDDTYKFKKTNGQDVIKDSSGNDAIVLEGVNFSQVKFVLSGGGSDLKLTGYNGSNFVQIKDFFYYQNNNNKIESFYFDDIQLNLNNLYTTPFTLSLKEFTRVGVNFNSTSVWSGPLKIVDMPNTPENYSSIYYRFNEVSTTQYNDEIFDGKGLDKIYAKAGNDVLYSQAGADELYGGDGDDVYKIGAGVGHRYISEDDDSGSGNDRVEFASLKFSDARIVSNRLGQITFRGNDWNTLTPAVNSVQLNLGDFSYAA